MLWLLVCLFVGYSECLWKNGIVHYAINNKDYDTHSQDIIQDVFSEIQNETCVKFFSTQFDTNATHDRILYISNPGKMKTCPPTNYDYTKNVIDMPIGYQCLNRKDIARIIVDMLRASIEPNVSPINSYDLIMRFKEIEKSVSSLLSRLDRNYINAHYHEECDSLTTVVSNRRSGGGGVLRSSHLTSANINYYKDKVWPLAIVLFGIDESLRGTPNYEKLIYAMTTIQRETCIVFQEITDDKALLPKSIFWFGKEGADMPRYGFVEGNQTINLESMVNGAPGHDAHILNNLMRILGVHMMSNRYDRDNHLIINWKNIQQGKQQYLEKAPEEAWIGQIPYDFDSATHAPANYMCQNCDLGDTTVQPIQDRLWQRVMSIGHRQDLSDWDIKILNILYSNECRTRYFS